MSTVAVPRRLRIGAGIALLIAGVVLALVPLDAHAAELAKSGWWWRVNDGTVPVLLPTPNVPDGGLMVAGAPDGATALAALHFELSDMETSPVLVLTVAEGGDVGGDTAVLAACVTGSAWDTASGGNWNFKPFPACEQGSVNGIRSDDGASWTFALEPLVSDGIVDVTLVPGVEPDQPAGANGSTFQLVFEAPTHASLVTTPGVAPDTNFVLPDFGSTDTDVSAIGGVDLPPIASDAGFIPALPPSDRGLTATAPIVQGGNPPLGASPIAAVVEHRGLAALVLLLCGAAALWSARLPVPAPQRLGTFGTRGGQPTAATVHATDPALGAATGPGRFSRPRSGRTPQL
ncbi:MAG: hypothetical protein WD691_06280 [Acidimicrobiales bacterium]